MAGYRQLRKDYDLEVTEDGVTGQRGYIQETGGADTLPSIGDAFDGTYTNSLARKIRARNYHQESGTDKLIYIVSYSTQSPSPIPQQPDDDERRYQFGGEIMSLDDPSQAAAPVWEWDSDSADVTQPMFLTNIIGTITRTKRFASDAAKSTFFTTNASGYFQFHIGTINTVAFEDMRIGSVLFSGISGGTEYDSAGDRLWAFELEFTYRFIRDEAVAITQDDWLYLWRKGEDAKWDKPKSKTGAKFLYAKTDLTALF